MSIHHEFTFGDSDEIVLLKGLKFSGSFRIRARLLFRSRGSGLCSAEDRGITHERIEYLYKNGISS